MKKIRLDKYLADMKAGTRSEVRQMIRKGRVTVGEHIIRAPEYKVDPDADEVRLDGVLMAYEELEYWMLNKPKGVVSATRDRNEKTVVSLLPERVRKDLFPVGRLDKDTTGLLLLTNDGALAHALLSPRRHVDKTYEAVVLGNPGEKEKEMFAGGLDIGDEKPTLPAVLETGFSMDEACKEQESPKSRVRITIREGRYHQIKRMFEVVGMKVIELDRLSMGSLVLDETLARGEARPLTAEEITYLKELEHQKRPETTAILPEQDTDREG